MDDKGTSMLPITSCGDPLVMSTSLTVPDEVTLVVTAVPPFEELTESEVLSLVGTKAKTGAEEYRRFLRSGELIPAKAWTTPPQLQKL